MTWTTARPTQPGWYWHKSYSRGFTFIQIYLVYDLEDGGELVTGHDEDLKPVSTFVGEWAGPLHPPPP